MGLRRIAEDLWTGFVIIAAFIFIGLPLEADMKLRDADAKIREFFEKRRKRHYNHLKEQRLLNRKTIQ